MKVLHFTVILLSLIPVTFADGPAAPPATTEEPKSTAPPATTDVTQTLVPSVYLPLGAGEPQQGRNISSEFGVFPKEFFTCGKRTATTLNEAYTGPSSLEVVVKCDPTPARTIIGKADNSFVKFNRDFKKECELFTCSNDVYQGDGDQLEEIVNFDPALYSKNAKAPKPEKPETNICSDKKATYPEGSTPTSSILFANEGNCYAKVGSTLITLLETPETFAQVPRWLPANEDRLNLKSLFFSNEKSEIVERVPFVFESKKNDSTAVTYQKCDTTCDKGSIVKIQMNPGEYSMMVYLNPKECSSFRICFDPDRFLDDSKKPSCQDDFTIDVLFKSGVVVWGKKGRASIIEMMSPYHDEDNVVGIEFGYGVKTSKGDLAGEFYIGNDHREFVQSDSSGYTSASSSKLAFFFPSDGCLRATAGIFSKKIASGKTMANEKVTVVGKLFGESGELITVQTPEVATTTTARPIKNIAATTTVAPLQLIADASLVDNDLQSNLEATGVYVDGKWWWWAIYLGFVLGTLLTLAIGGGICYVLRRTVYGYWYRGMYRRYGCDVSATTAGLTGVGFGATTTAMQTISPGKTGATTLGSTSSTTGITETTGTTGSTATTGTMA